MADLTREQKFKFRRRRELELAAQKTQATAAPAEPDGPVMSYLKGVGERTKGDLQAAVSLGAQAVLTPLAGYAGALASIGGNDKGTAMVKKVAGAAYEPRSDEGKKKVAAVGEVMNAPVALGNAVTDNLEQQGVTLGPGTHAAYDALNAGIPMAFGAKTGETGPRVATTDNALRRTADLFQGKEGVNRIVTRNEQRLIGSPEDIAKVADTVEQAKTLVPGSEPTVGQAVADTSAGTAPFANEKLAAKQPGGPSIRFDERLRAQEEARRVERQRIETQYGPARKRILEEANTKGAADANMELPPPPGAVPHRGVKPGAIFSKIDEMLSDPAISKLSRKTLNMVKFDHKTKMKNPPWVAQQIATMERKIAKFDKDTKTRDKKATTLKALNEKLAGMKQAADNSKLIDATGLYTTRKEIGNMIRKVMKNIGSKTWDQKVNSKLEREVEVAIDEAIEAAGGKGWRDEYMNPSATRYQKVTADEARADAVPVQRTSVGSVAQAVTPSQPHIFSRLVSLANYITKGVADV